MQIFFLNPAKAASRQKLNGASMFVLGLDMLFTKKRTSQTVGVLLVIVIWRTGGGRDELLPNPVHSDWRPAYCPVCGQECWRQEKNAELLKRIFADTQFLCTECAILRSALRGKGYVEKDPL